MKHSFLWKSVKGSHVIAGCFSDKIKEGNIHTTSKVALELYLLLCDGLFFKMAHSHAAAPMLLLRYSSVLSSPVMHIDRRARMRNIIPGVCFDTWMPRMGLSGLLGHWSKHFLSTWWALVPVCFWSSSLPSQPPMTKPVSKAESLCLRVYQKYTPDEIRWHAISAVTREENTAACGDQKMMEILSNQWVTGELSFKLCFGEWS